ncbi:MAG TPA: transposase [Gammaproteobacteria bacterium]|nr:transposase [Gammaproteobacteria bacterium]
MSFQKQILPGTFEYTLSYLIDNELDLSVFDARYRDAETGAPAFDSAVLLKIVIYAYSRGITSSRRIEQTLPGEYYFHEQYHRQRKRHHTSPDVHYDEATHTRTVRQVKCFTRMGAPVRESVQRPEIKSIQPTRGKESRYPVDSCIARA